MVRRASDRSFNAKLMAEFDDSELIRGSESSDQADLKFLCGASSRLVHATEEQSKKCVSMEAMLMEIKNTLLQISNQLGIRPIDNESSQHVPPVTNFSDPYACDEFNRLPLDNRKSLLRKIEMPKSDPYVHADSMEALLREMKEAPSIEIPEFDASNVSDWLSKVEQSFRVCRFSDLDKLDLVAFSLEGDVLNWFNWEMIRSEFHSWDEFRRRLLLKFGAAPEKSSENVAEILEERASYTEKKGTVSASVTESAELSSQVIVLDDSHLEPFFDHGFQTEMQEVLKLKAPVGLENQKKNGGYQPISAYVTEFEEFSAQVIGLEVSHLEQIFDNGLQTEMKEVLKLQEPMGLENQKPAGTFTSKPVVSVNSLSFAVGTEETIFSGLSQTSQVWEPGGVLDEHVLVDFIVAAQLAEKYAEESEESLDGTEDVVPVAARGPEGSNELLFGTMYNTLHLLEMGFSKHEISMAIDKIGTEGQISPTLSEDCTHVLLEPRMQVKEALVNASLAKKPIILTNWVKLIAEKSICSEIPGYYKPSVRGEEALLDVVTTPVTDDAIFQLVLARIVSHEWHRWKHKTASVTSNDRVIAADIGRQAVLEQITKGVRHALLHNQLFALVADPVTQAVLHPVTTAARFGWVSVLSCMLWLLGTLFWSTSFKKQKFGKNWWYKFKHSLWQRDCGRELLAVEVLVAKTVVDIRYDDVRRRELLVQWPNLDSPATSCMLSTDIVRLCPTFKLEDKLRFEGGSIDTIGDVAGELIQTEDSK